MFARLSRARKVAARVFALVTFSFLAACSQGVVGTNQNTGQRIDTSAPVQVALLVPGGSTQGADRAIAASLENAARLAISDLDGVRIDLRVYNSGSDPVQAAGVATQAVSEGAKILLGPLYGDAAAAAGAAVAPRNVNVLAFSNNTLVAGGNVLLLGNTFDNTARRLANYAARNGTTRFAVVHGNNAGGQAGRDAITSAVRQAGAQVVAVEGYTLTQQDILNATPRIASAINSSGADAVFLTAQINADLPIIATSLPEAGINPADTRYIGLTRWNALPQALSLPGVQGGLFALPDQGKITSFENRYQATYGASPHPLAGLAYDGIAAIGALVASGNANALTKQGLTTRQGFQGTSGIFRFLPNGLNERGLAIAEIRNNNVVVVENAPSSFGGGGL